MLLPKLPKTLALFRIFYLLLYLLLLLAYLFKTPPLILAQSYYFNDEFNQERSINELDPVKWTPYPNQRCSSWPNIKESGGFIKLSQCPVGTTQFPYVVSKENPFPATNYSVTIGFQYTKVTFWGTGFALAEEAPVNGAPSLPAVLDISVWQDQTLANLRVGFEGTDVYTTTVNTNPHALRVDRIGQKYLVYLDNNLVYTSPDTTKEVKVIWMGNPTLQGSIPEWTEFKVDYIRVSQVLPTQAVIFIPGMGGSEFKTSQEIIWSQLDGHGGTFSHAYPSGEKVWVNETEAAKLGDDDYFDVLRLKSDGQTPEAPGLELTGNLTSFGYSDINSFFQELGYIQNQTYFIFPYDWRKDIKITQGSLDSLIEEAKTKTGQSKVNLVVHSLGGLAGRWYISDPTRAIKVNKLIELGVPHLGAVEGLKAIMYGNAISKKIFGIFELGIPASEVKDVMQNLSSAFQLLPSQSYYNFYANTQDYPYPFRDDRDIDNNKITGVLNFSQIKVLLGNLNHNMTVFSFGEELHNLIDPKLNEASEVKLYLLTGSNQPTLGQIRETWWITWPINLIPKRDEIFINGDDTVPLYSASLKSSSYDLSGGAKIYYVDQKHSDLVKKGGVSMNTVKSILLDDVLPIEVKDQKIDLEGDQISVDENLVLDLYDDSGNHTGLDSSGNPETNIPGTYYDSLDDTAHVFVKKSAPKVKVKMTSSKKTAVRVKIRRYQQDKITKTILYNDIPVDTVSTVEFPYDSTSPTTPQLAIGGQTISATAEATGSAALDQTPPKTEVQVSGSKDSSGNYTGNVTITLTGSDFEAGLLKTEYGVDNGQTVQTYTSPFTLTTPGTYTIKISSTDKLGNQELPQTLALTINSTSTSSSSSSSGSSGSSDSSSTNTSSQTTQNTASPTSSPAPVLAIRNNPLVKLALATSKKVSIINHEPAGQVLGITNQTIQQQANERSSPHRLSEWLFISVMMLASGLMPLSTTLLTIFTFHSSFTKKSPQ